MMDGAAMSGRALLSPPSGAHETSECLVCWLHVRTSYKVKPTPVCKAQEKEPIKAQPSPVWSESSFRSDLVLLQRAGTRGWVCSTCGNHGSVEKPDPLKTKQSWYR